MSTGETRWQLFNQCSKAMLQTYLGHINTRGVSSRLCLTDFNVKVNRLGMFQLQHAQSRKYVCFNRRRRIEGDSLRCFFIERINDQGYTEIESAWEQGLFLGFNSRGRFQDPATYPIKRKCFSWTKLQRFVPNSELHRCSRQQKKKSNHHPTPRHQESFLRNLMRASLLQKIRATEDGPYNLRDISVA
ncbi:fibroblast growth factor [Oesophagostomum dentatum]|uniref:Fibroblast growth factor n=1 Tax=Oesophagostomum dentatum TaxID=61180 RepID=A0A0B1TM98_OESDE|nr:fibroblast growth factor [Oesophagostomum dentatum]